MKQIKHLLKSSLVISLVLSLSACGYQLRKTTPESLGFEDLKLSCDIDESWNLCSELKQQIEASDVKLSDASSLELKVGPFEQKERVFTIQDDGSADEFELTHEAAFQLTQAEFPDRVYSSQVSARRIYRHNSSALLAKEREREVIENALNKSLANEIMRQLVLLSPKREQVLQENTQ